MSKQLRTHSKTSIDKISLRDLKSKIDIIKLKLEIIAAHLKTIKKVVDNIYYKKTIVEFHY